MIKLIKKWWRGRDEKFTVACDLSRWNGGDSGPDGKDRELLFRVIGCREAKRVASRWVCVHPAGQARVLSGWHYWPDEKQ